MSLLCVLGVLCLCTTGVVSQLFLEPTVVRVRVFAPPGFLAREQNVFVSRERAVNVTADRSRFSVHHYGKTHRLCSPIRGIYFIRVMGSMRLRVSLPFSVASLLFWLDLGLLPDVYVPSVLSCSGRQRHSSTQQQKEPLSSPRVRSGLRRIIWCLCLQPGLPHAERKLRRWVMLLL
jgi:hypothetical protein